MNMAFKNKILMFVTKSNQKKVKIMYKSIYDVHNQVVKSLLPNQAGDYHHVNFRGKHFLRTESPQSFIDGSVLTITTSQTKKSIMTVVELEVRPLPEY